MSDDSGRSSPIALSREPDFQLGPLQISPSTLNPKTGEIIYVASALNDTNIDLLTLTRH